jgi:hypothetical protein
MVMSFGHWHRGWDRFERSSSCDLGAGRRSAARPGFIWRASDNAALPLREGPSESRF